MFRFRSAQLASMLILLPAFTGYLTAQVQLVKSRPSAPASAEVLKYIPHMDLAGRAPTDLVEMPSGRRTDVATLRSMESLAARLRAPRAHRPVDPALLNVPRKGKKEIEVKTFSDAMARLNQSKPDDVLVTPSGKRITAAQLKYLQPGIEKRLGRPLSSIPVRPDLSKASAIKVPPIATMAPAAQKKALQDLLKLSDDKVLQSPDGKRRITVGELKQYLAKHAEAPSKGFPAQKLPAQKRRPQ